MVAEAPDPLGRSLDRARRWVSDGTTTNGSLRRRFARIALVVGLLGAGAALLPALPHEHAVELSLPEPSTVVGVELAWSRDGSEAIQGGSWRFSPGGAPKRIETSVKLPNGTYALDVTVRRAERDDSVRRTIELGSADRINVALP